MKIDVTNITLETKRLILRAFQIEDLENFFDYARVPGVGEAAGWIHHNSIEDTKKVAEMFIKEKNIFSLVDKDTEKMIGTLGLHEPDGKMPELVYEKFKKKNIVELGFVLSNEYWGKGLMPEAVSAVLKYLFENTDAEFVMAGYFVNNERSMRTQEKVGMKKFAEGIGKDADKKDIGISFTGITKEKYFDRITNR